MKDSLTGLDSYDEFTLKLQSTINNIEDTVISIDYNDIKHFKYFNDTYSYQKGDALLKDFAKLLNKDNAYERLSQLLPY